MKKKVRASKAKGKGRGGAGSVRALAGLVGRSHTAVAGWLRDSRWTFGPGPWDTKTVELIKSWAARTLAVDPSGHAGQVGMGQAGGGRGPLKLSEMDPGRQADVALKLEKLKTAQLTREIKLGQYHLVGDCEARRVRQIQEVKTNLLNLAESLPFPQEQKDVVKGRVQEILMRFAGGR